MVCYFDVVVVRFVMYVLMMVLSLLVSVFWWDVLMFLSCRFRCLFGYVFNWLIVCDLSVKL